MRHGSIEKQATDLVGLFRNHVFNTGPPFSYELYALAVSPLQQGTTRAIF